MTGVVRMLRSAPETEILLTEGCDELCSCCPSNLGGVCASHHKVAKIDARVLELCGLNPGKPVAWSKLASLAGERILRANRLSAVCAGCQWLSLCLKTTTIG